ncbi:TetR/AcrR family transcriptional regulator [Deinococcus pimensis]|uniref:TetR/AcrR family transcriptional regulator n=1 Tax=Deinococcus pimensis TaxID=309888 RepID=UPI0004B83AF4|nr:TetR/AcrR family transcriptional regulator [Deinococcus pimensis]
MITPASSPSLRDRRRARRTAEILDCALAVFGEKGYQNAVMDDIAERALLTRVALYKYFPDKRSLLLELRAVKLREVTARIRGAVEAERSTEGRVRAVLFEFLAFQDEYPGLFRVLFTSSLGPDLGDDPAFDALFALVGEVVASGQRDGDLDPELPTEELVGLMLSLALTPSIKRNLVHEVDGPLAPQVLPTALRVFLHGARKRGGEGGNASGTAR